jgi:DNA processing protein
VIAGLALATVVVEARERSGALITADFALELGRDVFAVPGEITAALSSGTNRLIRQGAAPLLGPDDVFSALGLAPARRPPADLTDVAARVLNVLADAPSGQDEVVRATGLAASAVAAALVELELAGLAAEAEGVHRATRVPERAA